MNLSMRENMNYKIVDHFTYLFYRKAELIISIKLLLNYTADVRQQMRLNENMSINININNKEEFLH